MQRYNHLLIPFKPLKKTSLKHLTFKTAFVLDLGSGKCRSEFHALLKKNIGLNSPYIPYPASNLSISCLRMDQNI